MLRALRREATLLRRVLSLPAPHRIAFALAVQWAADHPTACPTAPPQPGKARDMTAFASRVWHEQVTSVVCGGRHISPKTLIAPSGIAGAGAGCFAKTALRPGELVTLYPGAVYAPLGYFEDPSDLPQPDCFGDSMSLSDGAVAEGAGGSALPRPPRDSEYVLVRHGGFKIDASPLAPQAELEGTWALRTPHACGHKLQHPPAGTAPNTLEVPVVYRIAMPSGSGGSNSNSNRGSNSFSGERGASGSSGGTSAPSAAAVEIPFELRHRVPHWWPPSEGAFSASPLPPQLVEDVGWSALLDSMRRLHAGSSSGAGDSSGSGSGAADAPALAAAAPRLLPHAKRNGVPLAALPPFIDVPGFAMVATRAVAPGEELYLDYGFVDDGAGLPPWYTEVSDAAVKEAVAAAEAGAEAARKAWR